MVGIVPIDLADFLNNNFGGFLAITQIYNNSGVWRSAETVLRRWLSGLGVCCSESSCGAGKSKALAYSDSSKISIAIKTRSRCHFILKQSCRVVAPGRFG